MSVAAANAKLASHGYQVIGIKGSTISIRISDDEDDTQRDVARCLGGRVAGCWEE